MVGPRLCPGCAETEIEPAQDYCDDCADFMRRPEVSSSWDADEYAGGSAYDKARDEYERLMEDHHAGQ